MRKSGTKTKRKRSKDRLHHGAVERELRRLNDQGALVERQRDLVRTVLMALVFKLGGTAELSKEDFELAHGGSIEVGEVEGQEGALVATFTPREGVTAIVPAPPEPAPPEEPPWWKQRLGGWVLILVGAWVGAAAGQLVRWLLS